MDRATVALCEMTDGCSPELDRGTAAQGRGWSAETTVDQALIRGLGTAFRVFVSGLVLCLEGGRRAEPGRGASDRSSPSVAPSPALCSRAWSCGCGLSTTASCVLSSDGCHFSR